MGLEKRLTFNQFVDKLFWVLIMILVKKISEEAGAINHNIQILNEKMAVLVTTVANQDKRMDGLDRRIDGIELRILKEP